MAKAREVIADCIGARPDEIYFTSGGTESDNWALKGSIEKDDKRLTIVSAIEHHAIINACATLERFGRPVAYLPVDAHGRVSPDLLRQMVSSGARLVSVMTVNNELGVIEPIKELATVARDCGALFHTDAVQGVGHIPIDVQELGVDMLSASGHKFNGPKGIGFLYVKRGTPLRAFIDGGAQESRMRAGTENVASIVGMAAALKKNRDDMAETTARLRTLEQGFFNALKKHNLDFIRNGCVNGAPGLVSVSFRGWSGETLLHRLDLKGISISTGSACDSVETQVSRVIKAIGVPNDYAQGTIRISFGRYNRLEDGSEIANAIASILLKG